MKKALTLLFIILLGFTLYFFLKPTENQDITIEVFTNSDYEFSLEYPSNWNKFSEEEQISPKFNFYLLDSLDDDKLPLDHFSNQTHTSVFPLGIPTENVMAQFISVEESGIDFPYELTEDSKVFVLETGEPFAAYLKLKNSPDSWNSSGFVWVRVAVNNLETRCERAGEIISSQECDPFVAGDTVIWNGEVDSDHWDQAVSIAESFNFNDTFDDTPEQQIVLENPNLNEVISSPLILTGKVKGTWLFEATAPIVLVDWDRKIIGESFIETNDDWMTEDFVSFSGEIKFEKPEDMGDFSDKGTLIFKKANPSGLPQNDDAVETNVRFR